MPPRGAEKQVSGTSGVTFVCPHEDLNPGFEMFAKQTQENLVFRCRNLMYCPGYTMGAIYLIFDEFLFKSSFFIHNFLVTFGVQ